MTFLKSLIYALLGVLLIFGSAVNAKVYQVETSTVGGAGHTIAVAMSMITKQNNIAEMQIQGGQTLTKSGINLAQGKTDIVPLPNAVYNLMTRGVGPYKTMGKEKSSKMAGDIQALFGFVGAIFLPMSFQDSGIETWDDFKGKKIFVGPPKGAAAVNAINLIKTVTGFEPGEDYEELRMGWGAAQQAMLDRKIDVMIRTATEPSPLVQQIISASPIRMFGAPKEIVDGPKWSAFTTKFGGQGGTASTKTYPKGVKYVAADGDKIHVFVATFFMGVHKDMSEEEAYQLTNSFYNNMDTFYGSAASAKNMRVEEVMFGMSGTPGLKLHPGAIRAHQERGVSIPDQYK
mgnify:CR=1 FL=1